MRPYGFFVDANATKEFGFHLVYFLGKHEEELDLTGFICLE